ncbi:hypothetical protein niasHT_022858 [Heterodera trifolii]|uniref:Ankyrin repeat protein n=1 Tax=Heterodera trifolii TaxID=157864 RepID=A0ABD2K2A0_9BILA
MGEKIITDHIKTTKHKKNLAEFNRNVPLTDFVKQKSASEEKLCLAAELTLAYHCARHNFSMDRIIERRGAIVNFADKNGLSPLMGASVFGHIGLVSYLIELGATIVQKDDKGRTALQLPMTCAIRKNVTSF